MSLLLLLRNWRRRSGGVGAPGVGYFGVTLPGPAGAGRQEYLFASSPAVGATGIEWSGSIAIGISGVEWAGSAAVGVSGIEVAQPPSAGMFGGSFPQPAITGSDGVS